MLYSVSIKSGLFVGKETLPKSGIGPTLHNFFVDFHTKSSKSGEYLSKLWIGIYAAQQCVVSKRPVLKRLWYCHKCRSCQLYRFLSKSCLVFKSISLSTGIMLLRQNLISVFFSRLPSETGHTFYLRYECGENRFGQSFYKTIMLLCLCFLHH